MGGCVPSLHFRALAVANDPLPAHCKLIERCDYRGEEQERCEMADLSVAEPGGLAVCGEETWGG